MRRLSLLVLMLLMAACAPATPEQQVLDDAAEAVGGASRIRNLKALTIQGTGAAPNAGQNRMPDDELPVWKVNEYTRRIDLENGRMRAQQVREAQFLFAGDLVQRQTQGLDGAAAYNVAAKGTISRAGALAARDRRIEFLHHPATVLRTVLDAEVTLNNFSAKAGERLVDITMPDGEAFTLGIDATTHLPTRVVSKVDNPNMGDVAIETRFADYEEVGGLKLPRRLTTKMDQYLQFDLQVSKNTLDGDVADLAIPAELTQATGARSTGGCRDGGAGGDGHLVAGWIRQSPQRGVRVRRSSGAVRSTAQRGADEGGDRQGAHAEPEAADEGDRVASPLRSFRRVPSAIAEGLTIVTHRSNQTFFESLVARQHTIVPDALEKNHRRATFEFVDDRLTLRDKSMEVQLYHLLDNPREGTNLYAYVPRERILVQADLYDATWLRHSWGENVLQNLERRGLKVDRSVPVHGVIEPFEQMVKNIKSKPS